MLNIAGMLFASTLFVGFTNSMTVQHTIEVQRCAWVAGCACGRGRMAGM